MGTGPHGTHWGQGPESKEAKAVTGGIGVKRSNEVAEAPMKKREVTTPGCCSVNLGHSHSSQVVKGHRDSIHHTLFEDISGQMQSQDSSSLTELRKECHCLRKTTKKQNATTTPQKKQFSCPCQQIPSSLLRLDPGVGQALMATAATLEDQNHAYNKQQAEHSE